ncbi:MAG: hypothetical protein WKF90_03730 [Pyrinomonadaceae bacterium]
MMNKNEKAEALESDGLIINLERGLTNRLTNKTNSKENRFVMNNNTPNRNEFQYDCSFCLRELPNGGIRFNSFGACPRCYRLAHLFVDALRGHRANYFNNLGVRK